MDEKDLQKIIVESINNALNEAILREHIDSIVRECLFEAKTSKKNNSNKNISTFFEKPGINNAQYAYKLAGIKPKKGKDTKKMKNARSLFAKKKNNFVDDRGNKYEFTPKEVNKLTSLISNNKLN